MIENIDFTAPNEPLPLFAEWFALAQQHEPNDPSAMTLATVGDDGAPSARIMLMKGYDASGFTFFTNRQSHKGNQLAQRQLAALCFHWKSLRRQVRIEGDVAPVGDSESDEYFATRPRGSQIGAWASQQSRPLASRAALEEGIAEVERRYVGQPVPRPPHWGGYRVTPRRIEFWQDREFRLHDRIIYTRDDANAPWQRERFFP